MKPKGDVAWLYMGDFNEILYHHEKYGAIVRSYTQMKAFREAVEECGPSNLGFQGVKYT